MTRILITGSRHWSCPDLAEAVLARLFRRYGPGIVIVHGDCPTGVDRSFREACVKQGIAHEPHPAQWDPLGPGAGPARNTEMVAAGADLCVAFSKDLASSRGTRDCVRKAVAAGIPTWLIESEDAQPVRLKADDPRLR